MNRYRSLFWCLGTVCLAAIVSFLVVRGTLNRNSHLAKPGDSEASFHDWLHENLEITSEQERLLQPHETAFEKDRKRIRLRIQSAGLELANAIREFDADSAEVTEARENLTLLQGELQQVTLDHFFAMKEHLTEEQGEKLLRWTHNSIIHGYHD